MLVHIVPFCPAQFNVTYCLYFFTFIIEQINDDDDDGVLIGSSPPLAYCTIFIVMSSEVVDLHICICIRTSHS